MDNVADVGGQQHHGQRADDGRAVAGDDGAQQAEHADGGQLQDQLHALHEDVVQVIEGGDHLGVLLAHQDDGEAQQHGHDDDLEHVGIHHGLEEIGGEDIHQGIHKGGGGGSVIGQVGGGHNREGTLEQIAAHQADDHGEGGGTQVEDHGLQADGANLADVAHGDNAAHDGEQDNGHHDEFDQVQEDGAEGLDVVVCEIRAALHQKTGNNGQHHGNEDLRRQGQFFLFLHK